MTFAAGGFGDGLFDELVDDIKRAVGVPTDDAGLRVDFNLGNGVHVGLGVNNGGIAMNMDAGDFHAGAGINSDGSVALDGSLNVGHGLEIGGHFRYGDGEVDLGGHVNYGNLVSVEGNIHYKNEVSLAGTINLGNNVDLSALFNVDYLNILKNAGTAFRLAFPTALYDRDGYVMPSKIDVISETIKIAFCEFNGRLMSVYLIFESCLF